MTRIVAANDSWIRLTQDDANQSLDNSSTRSHDEPRSEDEDPLKNPEQRTQETILNTLPITIQKNRQGRRDRTAPRCS